MDPLLNLRQSTGAGRCPACGKCTSMCPLAGDGGFSPRKIASQGVEEEMQGEAEGVSRCLTCGACETRCPQGVKFTDYVRGLREMIPPEERRSPPHDGVFESVARSMTGDNEPTRDLSWIGDGLEIAEEGETALFVGCLPFFDLYFKERGLETLEIARSAIRLLNKCGIKPVVLAQERCCGHDSLWGGDKETFDALAKANAETYASRGVKHILTTCAECCRTWSVDYAEAVSTYQPKVEHMAEFLAAKVESGDLKFRENGHTSVTFQDPCRLGRHLGVTEAPRKVLDAMPGTERVEMNWSGQDALCCGTSGFIHCDSASRGLQEKRLAEASDTGAATLVTACPKCLIHFSCAQAEDRQNKRGTSQIEVKDFTVLAASLLAEGDQTEDNVPAGTARDTGEAR